MGLIIYIIGAFITGFLARLFSIIYDEPITGEKLTITICCISLWPVGLPVLLGSIFIWRVPPKLIKWFKKRAEDKIKLKEEPEFVVYNPEVTEGSFRDAPKCTACGRIYLDKVS